MVEKGVLVAKKEEHRLREFLIRKLIQSQKNSVYCKNCGTRCFCVHFLFLSP